ncbi:A/G-specific adenine glycosylase [Telmatobacter sp. DSM 110680]|uniref:Adenine DNA glycosylase n=1 Tax=Telmatobacter sp. DSM 110680 TaxID=3036704 RepID=A0AAU7DN15_9BACT
MLRRLGPEVLVRMRRELLGWYERNKRDLPWRRTQDPYAIWVSEVMLQQTRVAVVIDRWKEFLERFPTVEVLAAAGEQEVLALWSGLGYYRRARMLHKAAQAVVAEHGGIMPVTAEELKKLSGIGSYTAAAIASIAHNEHVAVVDGNVERVLSRIRGWESHDAVGEAAVRRKVEEFSASLVDPRRPGDFNQAIMELGATVCTPRNPQCLVCPWASECRTLGEHKTPRRAAMTNREIACALVLREADAGTEVLLEQRAADNTVMPGMWELPALEVEKVTAAGEVMTVRHAIMQVNYTVRVHPVTARDASSTGLKGTPMRWFSIDKASTMALTGLARKVLTRAGLLRTEARSTRARFASPPITELV